MLFEDMSYLNSPKKGISEYDFAIDIMSGMPKELKIYGLEEALEKGNLYPSLYEQYKSYEPKKLIPRDERERRLLKLQELDFSINDLNLYLDLYPNDAYANDIFRKYVREYKRKKKEFTDIYGPLTLECETEDYEWVNSKWPWEEGGM